MESSAPIGLSLPYLAGDLPGIGGAIKQAGTDFVVDEVPAYEPCGVGTHTFFRIEKEGLTTPAAIRILAKALGRHPREFGFAGLKDAHAVTRQTMSLEHVDPEQVAGVDVGRIRILWVNRHGNKIKLGHSRGNRFDIKVRNFETDGLGLRDRNQRAEAILAVIRRRGLPNYFGPQRFGARGDNALIGRAILLGDYDLAMRLILGSPGKFDHGPVHKARALFDEGRLEESGAAWPRAFRDQQRLCQIMGRLGGDARRAWKSLDRTLKSLYLNAFQSALFNQVLARRIKEFDRVQVGDIACKHLNGACFLVEDAAKEQPRCDQLEISATGPIFGSRMTAPQGETAEIERLVLHESGVALDEFQPQDGVQMQGERRPLRVPLTDAQCETGHDELGPFVRLNFSLPPGSYATCVTRELCKTEDRPAPMQ